MTLVAAAALALGACTRSGSPPTPPATSSPVSAPATERVVGPLTAADAQALATMNGRLEEYVALHKKIERALPTLPTQATPEQIDRNQRAFERLVREARTTAGPGDLFTPEARPVIKRLLATVFGGPGGRQVKASIMDENPVDPVALMLTVNGRYPDSVPLTIWYEVQLPLEARTATISDAILALDKGEGTAVNWSPVKKPKA